MKREVELLEEIIKKLEEIEKELKNQRNKVVIETAQNQDYSSYYYTTTIE